MLRTAKICQWPRLPSEYWNLPEQGYTETECKQFDEAVVEFWDWFQNKKEETVLRKPSRRNEGKVPHPRYASEAEILAEYYRSGGPTDPIAASITDDDIRDLLDAMIDDG